MSRPVEIAPVIECMECGDDLVVDPITELCEMCFEFIFGEDAEFPE